MNKTATIRIYKPWQRWIAIAIVTSGLIMWDIDWGRDSAGCKASFNTMISSIRGENA